MGHRHLFRTSQMFQMDHDQNLNDALEEQPYLHMGATRASENGPFVFPTENLPTRASHWNSALRSNEYPSSSVSMELPQFRLPTLGPFCDPIMNPSAAGSFCLVPQNYADCPSSSYRGHVPGVKDDGDNSTMANGRGQCKRKSPVTSVECDRASTSSYYISGTSSDFSSSSNLQPEKLTLGSQSWAWDPMGITPNYRESGPSAAESSQRNVRSRSTLDLEVNLARTHLSNDPYHHLHSAVHPLNHNGINVSGASASSTTHDWDHITASTATCWRIMPSDTNGFSQGMDQFPVASSSGNGSMELSGHHHGLISSRNSIAPLHNLHCPATHAGRGGSNSAQRSMPAYRGTSSYPRLGYMTHEDGLNTQPDAYSSRHSRPLSTIGWRSSERNGRSRISYERLRSLSDNANVHDRFISKGLMMMDRSAMYGSRSLLDQHRDMRIDVDNMSYEELLALGERIGSVCTGLSEDSISKCLREMIYHSNQLPEEGNCVICLEEYQNGEKVGMLVNCSHHYHVGCIKKWLLMKNVCPICKGPALEENLKK